MAQTCYDDPHTRKSPAVLGTTTGDHQEVTLMRLKSSRALRAAAIVSLLAVVTVSPCTRQAEAAPPASVTTPRQLVNYPTVWLVRTDRDWSPVEQAQPTLWIEGQPVTRYVVDRRGAENRLTTAP